VPEGIDLVRLPPYSPELQPAERLWPVLNEAVANQTLPKLDALETVLVERCRTLRLDQTCYQWWPFGAPLVPLKIITRIWHQPDQSDCERPQATHPRIFFYGGEIWPSRCVR